MSLLRIRIKLAVMLAQSMGIKLLISRAAMFGGDAALLASAAKVLNDQTIKSCLEGLGIVERDQATLDRYERMRQEKNHQNTMPL